ncbi:MAG: hypothetical protein LBJ67_16665 [Planctomycetaceae bacterium]|jgi:TPR repeat protein|nr:hypothetical protein [Planctomycetaceae bacterium]
MFTKQQFNIFINRFSVYLATVLLFTAIVVGGYKQTNAQQTDSESVVLTEQEIEQLKQKIDKGDTDAQVVLGRYHLAKKNFDLAVKLFRQAAEKGNAKGQGMYGACFLM